MTRVDVNVVDCTHLVLAGCILSVFTAALSCVPISEAADRVHEQPVVTLSAITVHNQGLALVIVGSDVQVLHGAGQVEDALRLGRLADLATRDIGGQQEKRGGYNDLHLVWGQPGQKAKRSKKRGILKTI